MIDPDGYRPNVGIIVIGKDDRLFWGRRVSRDGWQFPQGGIRTDETPREAMLRELREEIGLESRHIRILGATRGWLRYRLPLHLVRRREHPVCLGQKQVWFLCRLLAADEQVRLDAGPHPEFDRWRWVDYWYPVNHVVHFKRRVYREALQELAPLIFPDAAPARPSLQSRS